MNNSEVTQNPSDKVLHWASRRGMLELDLLLVPYVSAHAATLSRDDRIQLWDLLQEDDPWLFDHLVHRHIDKNTRHHTILKRILKHVDAT